MTSGHRTCNKKFSYTLLANAQLAETKVYTKVINGYWTIYTVFTYGIEDLYLKKEGGKKL